MSAKEARLLAQVKSPNVVHIENFNKLKDGRIYLVMEWIEGQTLQHRIRRGRGENERIAREWMRQCCLGMVALHSWLERRQQNGDSP